jgi:protein-S-isoprenylcysteine O-methyltransferase Ste14
LICYPPFIMMNPGGPLDYHQGTAEWTHWLADYPLATALAGIVLVLLTGIYAWATVAFGLRFSNLTHRGILTHGPYAWTKHPAYLSKNAFWWIATMPFLATTGNPVDMIRNTVVLAMVSGVYYWRARTEEKHLGADPAYRDYAEWMARNGPIARLAAKLAGGGRWRRRSRSVAAVRPSRCRFDFGIAEVYPERRRTRRRRAQRLLRMSGLGANHAQKRKKLRLLRPELLIFDAVETAYRTRPRRKRLTTARRMIAPSRATSRVRISRLPLMMLPPPSSGASRKLPSSDPTMPTTMLRKMPC